jgi:hypothetical protein
MQAGILSVFAQYERELIGQRTKEALAVKRAQGVRLGRPPAVSIDVRSRIRNDRNADKSLRSIAEALTKDGSPPPTRDVGTHRRSPTKPFWLHFTEVGAELRGTPPGDGQTGSLTFFNRTLFDVPIPPMKCRSRRWRSR